MVLWFAEPGRLIGESLPPGGPAGLAAPVVGGFVGDLGGHLDGEFGGRAEGRVRDPAFSRGPACSSCT
jgi:hypothetical protein